VIDWFMLFDGILKSDGVEKNPPNGTKDPNKL
jgi:hypothetical protein